MPNPQSNNEKNSSTSKSGMQNQSNSKPQQGQPSNSNNKMASEDSENQQGGQLEQMVSFIKENWKVVLNELVTAGVTAYLAHSSREKSAAGKLSGTSKESNTSERNH